LRRAIDQHRISKLTDHIGSVVDLAVYAGYRLHAAGAEIARALMGEKSGGKVTVCLTLFARDTLSSMAMQAPCARY
jgi:hypothetical protein